MPMHSCENKRIDKGGPSVGDANVNPEGQDTEKAATHVRFDAKPIAAKLRLLTQSTPHPLG